MNWWRDHWFASDWFRGNWFAGTSQSPGPVQPGTENYALPTVFMGLPQQIDYYGKERKRRENDDLIAILG